MERSSNIKAGFQVSRDLLTEAQAQELENALYVPAFPDTHLMAIGQMMGGPKRAFWGIDGRFFYSTNLEGLDLMRHL